MDYHSLRLSFLKIMIATKESFEPHSSEQLPASKRVYVAGELHPDIQIGRAHV